jgi:hypothetical protein
MDNRYVSTEANNLAIAAKLRLDGDLPYQNMNNFNSCKIVHKCGMSHWGAHDCGFYQSKTHRPGECKSYRVKDRTCTNLEAQHDAAITNLARLEREINSLEMNHG